MKRVKWTKVENIHDHVVSTLTNEAEDIPMTKIEARSWCLKVIDLNKLSFDKELISTHDNEEIHIIRRDGFIESIKTHKEIPPLIALGEKLYLVDGYARFRALLKLEIKTAKVICQICP